MFVHSCILILRKRKLFIRVFKSQGSASQICGIWKAPTGKCDKASDVDWSMTNFLRQRTEKQRSDAEADSVNYKTIMSFYLLRWFPLLSYWHKERYTQRDDCKIPQFVRKLYGMPPPLLNFTFMADIELLLQRSAWWWLDCRWNKQCFD